MHKPVFSAVDWLLINWDNLSFGCVRKVHNSKLIHSQKNAFLTYAQDLHIVYTAVMNKFFIQLTPVEYSLYTQSTEPIKTIYLYKGEQ
jgi:hypothetical protein